MALKISTEGVLIDLAKEDLSGRFPPNFNLHSFKYFISGEFLVAYSTQYFLLDRQLKVHQIYLYNIISLLHLIFLLVSCVHAFS